MKIIDYKVGDRVQFIAKKILLKRDIEQVFIDELEEDGYEWNVVYIIKEITKDDGGVQLGGAWLQFDDWWIIYKEGDVVDIDNVMPIFTTSMLEHVKTVGFVID